MKTILHFISVMDRAGQETLIMNAFRTIDRNQYNFKFLCTLNREGDYDAEIKKLGGEIYYTPVSKWESKKIVKYILYVHNLKKAYNTVNFDVLHIHEQHAFTAFLELFAAKMAGVKSVVVHSHNTSSSHIVLHKTFVPFLNLLKCQKMACSEPAAKWMFGKTDGVVVLKNGILSSEFCFNSELQKVRRNELGIEDNTIVLTHIGRFNVQKNQRFLVNVFSELLKLNDKVILLLIGKGELESEITDYVKALKIYKKIIFLGTRDDIPAILSASNLFIFPSLYEGLGITLIEAQASGLYCVISDNIPAEARITNIITACSLKQTPKYWANKIYTIITENRYNNYNRNDYVKCLQTSGFDIESSCKVLAKIYDNL
jgi:glycosyltransferase involved in cell wall biosynthesis